MKAIKQLAEFLGAETSNKFRILFKDGEIVVLRQVSTVLREDVAGLYGILVEIANRQLKHSCLPGNTMMINFNDVVEVTDLQTGQTIKL
jgi:hypothetical protein